MKLKEILLILLLFLLPTQLGKHFFLNFSYVNGVPADYLSITIYVTDILIMLLAIIDRELILGEVKKYRIEFGFLIVLLVANITASLFPSLSLYSIIKSFEIYVVYLIIRNAFPLTKWAHLSIIFAALFQLVLTSMQFISKSSVQGIFYWFGERYMTLSMPSIAKADFLNQQILRPYGTFSHPNSMSGFYLLLYAWGLSQKKGPLKNTLIILCSSLIFISFSKTAIITYVAVTLLYLLASAWKKKCFPCLLANIFITIVLATIFIQAKSDPFSLEKRLILLKQGIEIVKQHPLLGVGFGQYLFAQSTFTTPYQYFFLQPVHNIFLLFLMQAGFVISFFLLLITKNWLSRLLKQKYIWPVFFVLAVTGMADHYWITLQQNMLLLGIIFGLALQSREDQIHNID